MLITMSFANLKSFFGRRAAKLKLQILSDLHLEVGQQYAEWSSTLTFPVAAPFLILGGDIGRLIDYDGYLTFLSAQAARYDKVFLVLGNHEFYGLDHASGLAKARQLCNEPSLGGKVVLMDRIRWDDKATDVTLLGCTLWSSIPGHASGVVQSKVSDFKKINGWTTERHNEVHTKEFCWLQNQVAEINNAPGVRKRTIVVLTHHAPCLEGSSRPEHAANPWASAFATDLIASDLSAARKQWPNVKAWVFGHTHYTTDTVRSGIRIVANQRGYVLPGGQRAKEKEEQTSMAKQSIFSLSQRTENSHHFRLDKVLSL